MRIHFQRILWICIITVKFFMLFHLFQKVSQFMKMGTQKCCFVRDTITALDNQTFIISPYFDPREGPSVRVLAIIHVSVEELYCIFDCSLNQTIYTRANIDLHRDRFGFPYGTADLLCSEPRGCDYEYVSFQTLPYQNMTPNLLFKVKNRPPPQISSNFTVCISTLYGGYNNVLQIIQSIEMYKILGASRVTIYNTSCSQNVSRVLLHYIDEGILEVVPWPITKHLKTSTTWRFFKGLASEIGYYGQTAALNDCLYRNMFRSSYVLLNDIDEIILPVTDRNWPSLMKRLQRDYPNASVFHSENHIFSTSVNTSEFDLWPNIPGVNILRHPFRQPIDWKLFNDRKMIVNPRKIFQTSIHSALKFKGRSINLPANMTITFHCTNKQIKDIPPEKLIRDNLLWRYNKSLVPNVDKVIQKLFSLR
ncbi:beta-1,4-galactosyltransferase galt-1-like [Hyperolius riggenbachi]|uniref:beta-1,4-galactosyltransferase galt-1-like n=1 Tax=Hyperolius riggenbachi TaxID=752182 RepID=UPI0035A31C6B